MIVQAHPTISVIHLPHRSDRMGHLLRQFQSQEITDYKIWDGIIDPAISARGISKSHKQIVQWAKETGLPEVLICEDDMMFTSPNSFQFYLQNKPPKFDLYLGFVTDGMVFPNNTVKTFRGMVFYTIAERFYEKFLAVDEKHNIDAQMDNLGDFHVCYPFPIKHRDGYSDHRKRFCDDSFRYVNRKFYV